MSEQADESVLEKMARFRQTTQTYLTNHPESFEGMQFLLQRTGDPLKCFSYSVDIEGKLIVFPGTGDVYIPDDVREFFGSRIVVKNSRSRLIKKLHTSSLVELERDDEQDVITTHIDGGSATPTREELQKLRQECLDFYGNHAVCGLEKFSCGLGVFVEYPASIPESNRQVAPCLFLSNIPFVIRTRELSGSLFHQNRHSW